MLKDTLMQAQFVINIFPMDLKKSSVHLRIIFQPKWKHCFIRSEPSLMYWKAKVRYRGPIIYIVFNDYVDDVLDPISLIKSFECVNIMDGSSHSFVCLTFYWLCVLSSFVIIIVCIQINFVHYIFGCRIAHMGRISVSPWVVD